MAWGGGWRLVRAGCGPKNAERRRVPVDIRSSTDERRKEIDVREEVRLQLA